MHVAIVGLSGTGKSSVAPLLAAHLGCDWIDLDSEVERRCGRTVADLVTEEGEALFREQELAALTVALDGPGVVIATGGGLVTTDAARDLLASRCRVVWLRAAPDVLVERLDTDGGAAVRPLLAGGTAAALHRQATERGPLYEAVADVVVDVGSSGPDEVARAAAAQLGGAGRGRGDTRTPGGARG